VLRYLQEVCSPLEKLALKDTKKETLKAVLDDWREGNPEVCKRIELINSARRAYREVDLLSKVLAAGKLYVNFKVTGTKTNRMAGGSEGYVSKGGSINPQGIKKGNEIRPVFTLADFSRGEELDGGDFDAFEVSIAEAEYNDPGLREVLLSGQKIHGLFAEEIYKVDFVDDSEKYISRGVNSITYDLIMKHKDDNENDFTGWYSRGKKGVFGFMYGAQAMKTGQSMQVSEEIAYKGLENLSNRFPGIRRSQEIIYEHFAALRQTGGIGTAVTWKEPQLYVESFLGFRRYFILEFNIIRTIYNLANDLPDSILEKGKNLKVKRRDRLQTGAGAIRSALYAAAFGLQSSIMRAAANHKIQSPGGDITKYTQARVWEIQPSGCHSWLVMPMNIHDELECPCQPSVADRVESAVKDSVEHFKSKVPLLGMDWKRGLRNWGDKGKKTEAELDEEELSEAELDEELID
jgi:DNA polymerase I-like protein with 3'-5' exonuclease and polymerase domains